MRHEETQQGPTKYYMKDARAQALIDRYFPSWYPTDHIEARLDDTKVFFYI